MHHALQQLDGLGDAELGEWHEWSGTAYHLRRRLTPAEQAGVGDVVDIRGTDEARARARALGPVLRALPPQVLLDELGTTEP